jgi:hypothetical protein
MASRPFQHSFDATPPLAVTNAATRARLVVPLFLCLVCCGGPKWSIESVLVNPGAPITGTDPVNPAVMVAPPPGTPETISTSLNVVGVIRIRRDARFAGTIAVQFENSTFQPGGGRRQTTSPIAFIDSTAIRKEHQILLAMCKRIEAPGAEATVELAVEGVRVVGTTQAQVEVEVELKTSDDPARGWPVTWRAPKRLTVTCLRESAIQ